MARRNPLRKGRGMEHGTAARRLEVVGDDTPATDASALLVRTARGDEKAFAELFDCLSPAVFGLARRVIRDPARAEEVAQEVFLQVWQTAARYDPDRGSAKSWVLTLAHRRAVDAVRHDQAATNRDKAYDWAPDVDHDTVLETVTIKMEHEQVRRCLGSLTDLQRESIVMAYYNGHTYAEVATLLDANPATVKTRMRDGLVRLRDCLGVEAS